VFAPVRWKGDDGDEGAVSVPLVARDVAEAGKWSEEGIFVGGDSPRLRRPLVDAFGPINFECFDVGRCFPAGIAFAADRGRGVCLDAFKGLLWGDLHDLSFGLGWFG